MQGHSLLELIQEKPKKPSVRESLLIEVNDPVARYGFDKAARVRQIIKGSYSLTLYADQTWGELNNHDNDPDECHNLWDEPDWATKKAELILELTHLLVAQMDESPLSQRLA